MLIKVLKNNAQKLAKYIADDRIFSLVMKDDIYNYNYENKNIEFYFIAQDNKSNIQAVAFCIDKIHLYYSKEKDVDTKDFINLLSDKKPLMIAGSLPLLSKINDELKQNNYIFEKQEVMLLKNKTGDRTKSEIDVQKATIDDIENLCNLMENMAELSDLYSFEAKEKYEMKLCQNEGRVYVARHDGQIISAAETAFEKQKSAYICDVCTSPSFRGKGIATRVINKLCTDLLKENKYVWISHNNPKTGKLYMDIGFKAIGEYAVMQEKV